MKINVANKEDKKIKLGFKHRERLDAALDDDFLEQFTIKSVMALREALIQHFQDTGYSPPQGIQDKLMTIKDKSDLFGAIDSKAAQFKQDIESGQVTDFENDSSWS